MNGTSNSPRRVLTAALVGTSVEFYDFYIYSTAAALVLGQLFFPTDTPGLDLLLSYASFSVAFIARPLGAAVFGHFGDRYGRKSTLVASLLIMGICTFLIAFLPGYATIGLAAPVLLCILRFGQGFGLGGEWAGAALFAVENAPPGKRARYGMFPQLGAPVGFVFANGLFILLGLWLSKDEFLDWGWRIPFLGSALLIVIGLWVRLSVIETPRIAMALDEASPHRVPLMDLLRTHFGRLAAAVLASATSFAVFYLVTAFSLGYGTSISGIDRNTYLLCQMASLGFLAIGIVGAGMASDRCGTRPVMIAGCLLVLPLSMFTSMIGGTPTEIIAFHSAAFLVMGLVYGPIGGYLPTLFPPIVRYTGVAFAFNFAGIFAGGFTPLAAQLLASSYGLATVGYALAGTAILSLVGIYFAGRQEWEDVAVKQAVVAQPL